MHDTCLFPRSELKPGLSALLLARGEHRLISEAPYAFARVLENDRVLVAPDAQGAITLTVHGVFADGATVRDAYAGQTYTVINGAVTINASGTVLLESTTP